MIFKYFTTNRHANWTYGQNIENCDTPPLRSKTAKLVTVACHVYHSSVPLELGCFTETASGHKDLLFTVLFQI